MPFKETRPAEERIALPSEVAELGVEPRYIPPPSPQDNGRHERMHRTLRRHLSDEYPQEALGQATPSSRWPRARLRAVEEATVPAEQ